MKASIGIDIGSTSSELVIMNENKEIIYQEMVLTGGNVKQTGEILLQRSLEAAGLDSDQVLSIISTGYGRKNLDFASTDKTEISCYARGAFFINPNARTIIDIGGQDSKVISLDDTGKIRNFTMNDKCAAGTGKFLEMICRRFDIEMEQMGPLSLQSGKDVAISSICAVFAESEAISLISSGETVEDVFNGAHKALCERIAGMVERVDTIDEVLFCGGVARNIGMRKQLGEALGKTLHIPEMPEYVGAVGAALIGLNNKRA
ncbi:MAG: 2-hydroxyglutaryl-CoA dehydratase [Candidatus Aminicenantes bacterium]|nr:MAG: 2-hydroxyglutaryl-CoA dehydratase [Candidatus Aminicenantes bacterium]